MSNRLFSKGKAKRTYEIGQTSTSTSRRSRLTSSVREIIPALQKRFSKAQKKKSTAVTVNDCVRQQVVAIFQTPENQKRFLMRWVIKALETLKSGKKYSEKERHCLEILTPIQSQLELLLQKELNPVYTRSSSHSKTACEILSINLDTPKNTVDFVLRLWEFSLLCDSDISIQWTFDRSLLLVDSTGFIPNLVCLCSVDHFSARQQELSPVFGTHYHSDSRFPTIDGLWSIFYGWLGWVTSSGRLVENIVLPHPIFPRLYVTDTCQKFLHLVPDYGRRHCSRVFVTLFDEGGFTTQGHLARKGETAIFGPSGLVTRG